MVKRIVYFSSIATAAIIAAVLIFLPYKSYAASNATVSILDELRDGFTGDYISLIFLAVFFPVLILAELPLLSRHSTFRFFLPVQGLLLLLAALFMNFDMTFELFQSARLLPAFYAALAWVSVAVLLSILLAFKRIQKVAQRLFFNLRAPAEAT